jgi:hypothetical protein
VAAGKPPVDVDPPCCLFDVGNRKTQSIEGLDTKELPCLGLLAVSEPFLGPVGDGGAESAVPVVKKERPGGISGHGSDSNGLYRRPCRAQTGEPGPGDLGNSLRARQTWRFLSVIEGCGRIAFGFASGAK